jgi:hypothetical protein
VGDGKDLRKKVEWRRREPSDINEARRVSERARANQSGEVKVERAEDGATMGVV